MAKRASSGMTRAFHDRYRDVVASIYIYNEHRGYTSLDRVLAAARRHCPADAEFLAAIAQHRADERKHYVMFRRWFEREGRMPLAVDRSFGHIDRFVQHVFGCGIDGLDTDRIVAEPDQFERLCRVIVLTEERGLAQVGALLRNRAVREDRAMLRLFEVIHRDEPSHFLPYRAWLDTRGRSHAGWRERYADWCIHKMLLLVKLPGLFFSRRARRLSAWPDAGEQPGSPV